MAPPLGASAPRCSVLFHLRACSGAPVTRISREGPFRKVGRLFILGTLAKYLLVNQSSLGEIPHPQRGPLAVGATPMEALLR